MLLNGSITVADALLNKHNQMQHECHATMTRMHKEMSKFHVRMYKRAKSFSMSTTGSVKNDSKSSFVIETRPGQHSNKTIVKYMRYDPNQQDDQCQNEMGSNRAVHKDDKNSNIHGHSNRNLPIRRRNKNKNIVNNDNHLNKCVDEKSLSSTLVSPDVISNNNNNNDNNNDNNSNANSDLTTSLSATLSQSPLLHHNQQQEQSQEQLNDPIPPESANSFTNVSKNSIEISTQPPPQQNITTATTITKNENRRIVCRDPALKNTSNSTVPNLAVRTRDLHGTVPVDQPLQLPCEIYNKGHDKFRIGFLIRVANPGGYKSTITPEGDGNMKALVIIQLQGDNPTLYSTPTRALKDSQDNTENGWAGWRVWKSKRTLRDHKIENGGGGFINSPWLEPHHVDFLTYHCVEQKKMKNFYHDRDIIRRAKKEAHIRINEVLYFVTQDSPEINKVYEQRLKTHTELKPFYSHLFLNQDEEQQQVIVQTKCNNVDDDVDDVDDKNDKNANNDNDNNDNKRDNDCAMTT